MSQGVWGYWLIALGIGVMSVMMLVQNYTTINQEDYYMLKEVTQASMVDAIDFKHYQQYGELKINKEKFVENFIRRFSSVAKGNKNYKLDFYDIYETPPKVSVRVSTGTASFNVSGNNMDSIVTNDIDAILESNSKHTITETFYAMPYASCPEEKQDYLGYCSLAYNQELSATKIKTYVVKDLHDKGHTDVTENDLSVISIKYIGPMSNDEDMRRRDEIHDIVYNYENNGYEVGYVPPSLSGNNLHFANEIVDVNITVVEDGENERLVWGAKYKCYGDAMFGDGAVTAVGSSIADSCNIGLKYEVKFSY